LALILADTDVLIDYFAGRFPIESRVRDLILAEELRTSAVTVFELLCGAKQDQEGDLIRNFLTMIEILPVDTVAAALAAAEQRRLMSEGYGIQTADALIAGVALANGLSLLTRNTKHFARISGLTLLPPS
jgi:tRNA(fMet)-specific endonuclease VapC